MGDVVDKEGVGVDGNEEAIVASGEGDLLGGGVVGDDVKGVVEFSAFFWGIEKELSRRVAEEGGGAGDAVLWTLEAVIRAGFRGVVRAENGHVMLLGPAIQEDQLRGVRAVLFRVPAEEDHEGVDDEQVAGEQGVHEFVQEIHGPGRELREGYGWIIDQRARFQRGRVDLGDLSPVETRVRGAVREDVADAEVRARGQAPEDLPALGCGDDLHKDRGFASPARAGEDRDFICGEDGGDEHVNRHGLVLPE